VHLVWKHPALHQQRPAGSRSCQCAGFSGGRCKPGRRTSPDGNRVSRAYQEGQISPKRKLLSGACVPGGRLDLSRAAVVKLTSGRIPIVHAVLNGRCFLCLFDTGSEQTLVSPRVVGIGLRPGRPLLTANGSASHVSGMSRIVVGLQGHCFSVTAPVMN